jgi:hypothetical protein
MQEIRSSAQEAAEDIFFGQLVIIVARWFLILAATVLVLWNATQEIQLIRGIVPIVALMAMNFYLHGRYLLERPANRTFITAASVLDLLIIAILVWLDPGGRGFVSQLFVLYFPVLIAFGFVFPSRQTALYTLIAMAIYGLTSVQSEPTLLVKGRELELLVERLTIFASVGFLSTYYWRIQRDRRRLVRGDPAAALR